MSAKPQLNMADYAGDAAVPRPVVGDRHRSRPGRVAHARREHDDSRRGGARRRRHARARAAVRRARGLGRRAARLPDAVPAGRAGAGLPAAAGRRLGVGVRDGVQVHARRARPHAVGAGAAQPDRRPALRADRVGRRRGAVPRRHPARPRPAPRRPEPRACARPQARHAGPAARRRRRDAARAGQARQGRRRARPAADGDEALAVHDRQGRGGDAPGLPRGRPRRRRRDDRGRHRLKRPHRRDRRGRSAPG